MYWYEYWYIFIENIDFINFKNILNENKIITNVEFKLVNSINIEILSNINASMHVDGENVYMICVINDITKKRNVEAFLSLNKNIDKLIKSNADLANNFTKKIK